MASRTGSILAILTIAAFAVAVTACGDDAPSSSPTPAPSGRAAAERPAWFPASFPLPAETTVVAATEAEGGGTVQFNAPVPLSRAILILDSNLETESHAYTIVSREASETGATYEIENDQFTGTVQLTPSEGSTLIDVALKAKP